MPEATLPAANVVPPTPPKARPIERPENIPEATWNLGKSIGNISLAQAIVATDNGVLPSDPEALNDFLVVTSNEATKALKRYVKLNSTIGRKLSDAYKEWQAHKKRESRLFAIIANDGKLPESADGAATAR